MAKRYPRRWGLGAVSVFAEFVIRLENQKPGFSLAKAFGVLKNVQKATIHSV
jgi:hypothetical protein